MNPCSNHPPNFPPWHGKLSPLIDQRARDIEIGRSRMGAIAIFLLSGAVWAIIFVIIRFIVEQIAA